MTIFTHCFYLVVRCRPLQPVRLNIPWNYKIHTHNWKCMQGCWPILVLTMTFLTRFSNMASQYRGLYSHKKKISKHRSEREKMYPMQIRLITECKYPWIKLWMQIYFCMAWQPEMTSKI